MTVNKYRLLIYDDTGRIDTIEDFDNLVDLMDYLDWFTMYDIACSWKVVKI